MDRVLRILGRLFIVSGVVILLFLGYQLFGTNFVADGNQKALAKELDATFKKVGSPAATPTEIPTFKPDLGEGIARIQIPKIGVDWIVVEGVSVEALKKGPGHYPGTALPGEPGNLVISGHRTTYGAPFFRLDEVTVGDTINVVAVNGIHMYKVTETKIVAPTDLSVVVKTEDSRLTLTTCHPRFSARQRLIVVAALVPPESGRALP